MPRSLKNPAPTPADPETTVPPPLTAPRSGATRDVPGLLHELQVAHLELTMQNEELRAARQASEQALSDLAAREKFLHCITDNLPAMISYWDRDLRCRFANPACCRWLRRRSAEMPGLSLREAIGESRFGREREHIEAALRGESRTFELAFEQQDGTTGYHQVHFVPDHDDGTVGGLFVLATDITARKRADEERLAQALTQRDTLVREVHHRIKNNLQSVAGLLRRELGAFPEFDSRLQTAINQLLTISTVHGLQSTSSGEAMRFQETVAGVCAALRGQGGYAIELAVDGPSNHLSPARIAPNEAVAVALIVNELVSNACKHAPPDATTPVEVRILVDSRAVTLRVRNPRHADAAAVDFAAGVGFGTGLRLISALLPAQGARLDYHTLPGEMLVVLCLTDPVILPCTENALE